MTVGREARTVLAVAAALGLALAVAGVREAVRAGETGDGPATAGNRVERCRTCHDRPHEDPGGAHAAEAVGCEACHLGNALAYERDRAHEGLEKEPGALSTVARTCGRDGCHPREAGRVPRAAMATGRGLVAVDRRAFGEAEGFDGTREFADVLAAASPTPAEDHLRRLCLGCHLGTRGDNRDDSVTGIGSGCGACHSSRARPGEVRAHRPVDARVPDERCRGCHGRSARIALTYGGVAEVKEGAAPVGEAVALFDGRPGKRVPPDVHAAAGMACIDCHVHTDLMGDGTTPAHEEDAVAVTCEACHGPEAEGGRRPWGAVDDPVTPVLLRVRGAERAPGEAARVLRNGVPVWNLRLAGAGAPAGTAGTLVRKLDGVPLPVRATPADADHRLPGHRRLTCQACHSAGIPWCADCHTAYDGGKRQWDFGRGAEAPGGWVETSKAFDWRPPWLAVKGDRVVPAAPGMFMDLEARAAGGPVRTLRWVSSFDPHSTQRKARTCESCHGKGDALGPDDAVGTRRDLRVLDPDERVRTLRVGPCVTCHRQANDRVYADFGASWKRWSGGKTRCPFRGP